MTNPPEQRIVRIAYIDESGRSRGEPIIVAGGVIIHGDRDYRRIEGSLIRLVSDIIKPEDQEKFVFHAKELFHGGGYFKDLSVWPSHRRFPIIERLAGIIPAFRVPVVFGHLAKAPYRAEVAPVLSSLTDKAREEDTDIGEHMSVFAQAELAIEKQMRAYPRDEVCMVVAEDTDRVKRGIKDAHAFLRSPHKIGGTEFEDFSALPLSRVIDTPHFAAKADSPLLQLADLCSFLIKRRLERRENSQPFFAIIAPQIVHHVPDFGASMEAEQIAGGLLY